MKFSRILMLSVFCVGSLAAAWIRPTIAAGDEEAMLRLDRAAFGSRAGAFALSDDLLDLDFTWTDSSGNTRSKSEILQTPHAANEFPKEASTASGSGVVGTDPVVKVRAYDRIGVVQENRGKLYVLRIWVKHAESWRLLVYQAVAIGATASAESENSECENPCKTVPFQPQNADERDVIRAYQSVERAVTAHDSAAWGTHIADEFFAVTSNSDRPLDKATRMAGLDNRKVAGIAPFPLISAHMFGFGDAMVMTSLQRPLHGLPLHVTRIWFKHGGAWLEAYSYQTTIQSGLAPR